MYLRALEWWMASNQKWFRLKFGETPFWPWRDFNDSYLNTLTYSTYSGRCVKKRYLLFLYYDAITRIRNSHGNTSLQSHCLIKKRIGEHKNVTSLLISWATSQPLNTLFLYRVLCKLSITRNVDLQIMVTPVQRIPAIYLLWTNHEKTILV